MVSFDVTDTQLPPLSSRVKTVIPTLCSRIIKWPEESNTRLRGILNPVPINRAAKPGAMDGEGYCAVNVAPEHVAACCGSAKVEDMKRLASKAFDATKPCCITFNILKIIQSEPSTFMKRPSICIY